MKVVSTDGLTKLIQLSKDNFIDKNDVIDMTSVFATVATTGDYEDLTNKPEEIPSQSGQSGKYLTTNGTTVSWASVPSNLPSQSGQSGKYLTTNGTSASWANVPTEIPSQTGNSGKLLTTNGSSVSWSDTIEGDLIIKDGSSAAHSIQFKSSNNDNRGYIYGNSTGVAIYSPNLSNYTIFSNNGIYSNSGNTLGTSSYKWSNIYTTKLNNGADITVPTTSGTMALIDDIPLVDQTYSGTSTNAQSGVAVKSAIDTAISSVYKPAGSVTFANKPSLSSAIEGNVYNISDAFTTTSDFVEGAGHSYPAGTNIVCINTSGTTYKWDVLAGFIDLSGYQTTITGGATTITSSDLTVSRALVSNSSGKVAVSDVTSTELGYLDGVTSSIQTQLNNKVTSNTAITGATHTKITYDSKGLVTAGADLSASDIPDISATYQTKITSSAKLSADLISDGTTNKTVTATEKSTWSGKQDELVSGTNIKTINNTTILGSGNIDTHELPSQSGNSGKFLTTDGSAVSWATVDSLPTQTGQSGKFLTTNGTTASWATVDALQNTATGTNSLTILGTATSDAESINIGNGSSAAVYHSVLIGNNISQISNGNNGSDVIIGHTAKRTGGSGSSIAIGNSSEISGGMYNIAIGSNAKVGANYGIQLGMGTNSEANTMYVSTSNSNNWKMLGSDGIIPQARLASGGTNGQVLMTNGTTASWATIPEELPSQSGQSGKFLTTNGSAVSWAEISAGSEEDNLSITKNASDKIQTVGVINQANSSTAIKTWSGTLAQYNALGTHSNDCLYYITDDTTAGGGSSGDGDNRITKGVMDTPQPTQFEFDKTTHTLTIKAGTKVYYPDGKDGDNNLQVREYTIESDITYNPSVTSGSVAFIVYNITQNQLENIAVSSTRTTTDGTTDISPCIAYNSTTNYIKKTMDTGTTWDDQYSFPLMIVTFSDGNIQCVKQVFQGATYIGKTAFFKSGYNVRIPNGIDSETKKPKYIDTQFALNRLITLSGNYSLFFELDSDNLETQYFAECNNVLVYEQEIMPDYRNTMIWYNPLTNYWYYTTDAGATWEIVYLCFVTNVCQLNTNYLSSFTPFGPDISLTTNDIRLVTHWCFPGKWRTSITPTSGSIYTAPGDGWFYISVNRTDGTSDAYASITGWETNYKVSSSCPSVDANSSSMAAVIMPVSSGNSVVIHFSGTVNECSFYYCNGSYVA